MLIAMAGLPGTGKSTLARALSEALTAAGLDVIVLDKDGIRADLFPPSAIEYSVEQDDLCFEIMLQVAAFLLRRNPGRMVILDGRTFSRRRHVERVVRAAAEMETPAGLVLLTFIECRCTDATALRRLAHDRVGDSHPAANRNAALYLGLKAASDPLDLPHLVVDTEGSLNDAVRQCRRYLDQAADPGPQSPRPER